MAAVAAASHPGLYDAGWHPTAVCGPIGAAVAAAVLLDLSPAQRENALAIALLRAGGTRGAFGSDGKAIQVGLAAAAGVQAAVLARAGATVDPLAIHGPLGFAAVLGATWPQTATDGGGERAIDRNWIKLYPSCLGTHAPIEAAARARDDGYRLDRQPLDVRVNRVARQAAHLDAVSDGLAAKFSIPYCVAHTLIHGPPGVRDFAAIDGDARDLSSLVKVSIDASLPPFGAVLSVAGNELVRVPYPKGAPERSVAPSELASKLEDLAGDRLDGVLADLATPAADALDAAGLRVTARDGVRSEA
jgi:2-methylcitrate dehydratase PrpD